MRTLKFMVIVCLIGAAQQLLASPEWQSLGNVTAVSVQPQGVDLTAGPARLRVTVLSSNVIRVRYARQGSFPASQSFVVLPNAFANPPMAHVDQTGDAIVVSAGNVQARISKTPLRVSFIDTAGNVISQDQPDHPVAFHGAEFRVWKTMPVDEHYFGLGDKSGPLDHRGQAFTMWNTDVFGWQESTDPLYKTIPVFLGVRAGSAYGIFLDNTYRSSFDFGKESGEFLSFGAPGGELDYYFFYGPDPKRVLTDFTALVGRSALPPRFALGYQQCRYSYYPEAQVRDVAHQFRERKIPADVIYLDIDYQDHNRPFTVDRNGFPDFEGMVKDLGTEGFKVAAITDLHIAKLPGYKPYDEGLAHDYFVHNPDGSVFVGNVWPGESVFPDFTRAAVRDWWGSLYSEFVKTGIRGFWNDMNEPALFLVPSKTMPLDTVHSVEGRKTDHREIHNVFGMENARGTYEGMLRLQPNVRPFVLTRAAYAGTQRYAASWTGDNSSTWNHLRISLPQMINLGLSGYGFIGADIGGFNGSPTPELLTRWMELGVFNPIFRNHAAKGTRFREPWVDGPAHEAIRKRYIETRYRLLPYIYTGMEEASRTGIPLMRPMFLEFPGDSKLLTNGEEFMFGEDLLVAPKVWEFAAPYEVTLPKGNWFDYWTGEIHPGGAILKVDPPLDTLPVYVREGSIIPQQPVVQHVEETPQGPLELRVYPGENCHGSLYLDDGNTFAYMHGNYLRINFTCQATPGSVQIRIAPSEGSFKPWFTQVKLEVAGNPPSAVQVQGKNFSDWNSDAAARMVSLTLPWNASGTEIRLEYPQEPSRK